MREAARQLAFMLSHPLGSRRPVRCLSRLLRWRVLSRMRAGPHTVAFAGGTRLWARRGETGVTGNIYVGLHEFPDMAFVVHALRPGDLFADIGANAGSYTVLASGVAGALTVAVEPAPETVERLRANVALNGLASLVTVECCAVTEVDGAIRFTTGLDTMNRVPGSEEADNATVEVPARRIDTLLPNAADLIKLDVEGQEAEAIAGAERTLDCPRVKAVVVELSGRTGVADKLATRDFRPHSYDPFTRSLATATAPVGRGNGLFVRDLEAVRERVRTAPPLTVLGLAI